MPVIAEKQKVLKGRGIVLRYANGNSAGKYFYRELLKGTKKYRYICIEEATSLEEAIEMASDAAIALREGTPQANQPIEKIRKPQICWLHLLSQQRFLIGTQDDFYQLQSVSY